MRDQASIEKLKSRIYSIEHQSLELQKQLKAMDQILQGLLHEMGDKGLMEMQKPDANKLT